MIAEIDGALLVDKPKGLTSHDVVALVRRRAGLQRVGHTGTLDPVAQGLLVLLLGRATKHQQALQAHEKLYEATIALGAKTDTGDTEGRFIAQAQVPALDRDRLTQVLTSFVGPLLQTPPAYSAVKVHGRPAYWWARRRRPVVLQPRTITVFELNLEGFAETAIHVRVRCSAGTYVRRMAEEIAERLGTVGHLASLTRLAIGPWLLEDAVSYPWLTEASPEAIARRLRSLDDSHARLRRP